MISFSMVMSGEHGADGHSAYLKHEVSRLLNIHCVPASFI